MQLVPQTESVYLDLSSRAKLRLTGTDRVRFLNGQVSNDVRNMAADASVYTAVMTIKGKLCADAFVHVDGESLLLDTEGELRESLAVRLERYVIADDVQIEDVSEKLSLLHLIDFAADANSPHLPSERARLAELGAALRMVSSTRYGHPGLDLFFDPQLEGEVRTRLHAGFTLLNEDAAESMRIAAGVPLWGAELDDTTMPAEADLEERAVSYSKGCYIGQEIVSRVKSVGRVNRHLRGFRALDSSPLYPGMILRTSGGDAPGSAVGRITSAAPSAGHGGASFIALGYVRRGWDAPGTRLDAVAALTSTPDSLDTPDTLNSALDATPPNGEREPETPACAVEVCLLPFV